MRLHPSAPGRQILGDDPQNSPNTPRPLLQPVRHTHAALMLHSMLPPSLVTLSMAGLLDLFLRGLRGGLLVGLINTSSGDTGFIMGELPTVYIPMILHFEPFTFRSVRRCWPRVGWQACLCCSQVPAGTDRWHLSLCSPQSAHRKPSFGAFSDCVQSDG